MTLQPHVRFALLVKSVHAIPGKWFTARCAVLVLLFCAHLSALPQGIHHVPVDTVVKPVNNLVALPAEKVEPNFTSFPAKEIMRPEVWAKVNPGKPYAAATTARYQTIGEDGVKYAEVIDKRTAYENFYINPEQPSAYALEKAIYPVNFQRNGEWIPIDPSLRPMGNDVYEAPDQWDPVGIQIRDRITYIRIGGEQVKFNNWRLYGVNGNDRTLLATADWSHYTIGADGIRIINIFPGIDAEMHVGRGVIKTSFIIHEYTFSPCEALHFEDGIAGIGDRGLYFIDNDNARKSAEAVYADVAGEPRALKIAPALGYVKQNYSATTSFPYHLSGNKLSIAVPGAYIINNLALGDVVIDPWVESVNSISQILVGTGSDGSCSFGSFCDYTISVTPPANSTIDNVGARVHVLANAPCGLENFAFAMRSGTCSSPAPGNAYSVGITGPGTAWPTAFSHPLLKPCMPAPSCSPSPVDFRFLLYRSCEGPIGCDNTCVGLASPLAVYIWGQTAELSAISITPANICAGGNLEFYATAQYGVPPFSSFEWSFDNFATIAGTGEMFTVPNTFAPGGPYRIYARATDACGILADNSKEFYVKPLPEITLGTGETVCDEATTNIVPASSLTGTTYSWTVVQTGVTGAAAGSGTSIQQKLTNTGTTPGTAVYTITPTASGCAGPPVTYTVTVQPVNNVLYVDALNGDDSNCGDAWTNALKTLSAALDMARRYTVVDSILVAEGTYYPTGDQSGTNRDSAFVIMRGKLKLFGGYPNGGGDRDVAAHPTILSGDIGVDNDYDDNSYHLMVMVDIPTTADSIVIDGFNFEKGNANGNQIIGYGTQGIYQGHGPGIYMQFNGNGQKTALRNLTFTGGTARILGGAVELVYASPYIQNCEFRDNRAIVGGGALSNDHAASPYVVDCRFINNTAHSFGGAVFTQEAASRPVFVNCSFISNRAIADPSGPANTYGGAFYSRTAADLTITNCIFLNNTATGGGGAICNGNDVVMNIAHSVFQGNVSVNADATTGTGGALQMNSGTVNIVHSVFVKNEAGGIADDGGGALMVYGGTITCTNVTMLDNETQSTGKPDANGISISAGTTCHFRNSIAWGAGAQVHNLGTFNNNHSLIRGTGTALPNLDLDPQFADAGNPVGPDGIWGTADDGLQLTPCSPAANMGNNAYVTLTSDFAGGVRILETVVDMGAYELQSPVTPLDFTDMVKTYGDPDAPMPNFTSCSGLPVTFTIADNTIATETSGELHILKAGTTTVTAHIPNGAADVTVNLTVNPKPVTVSLIAPVSKVYDGNANAVVSVANLQPAPGDVVGSDDVTIALSSTAAAYDTKDVGTGKTVTVPLANISLTGTSAANYIIANTSDVSAAIGVITPLAITVTADVQTKVYGDADPPLTYTVTPSPAPGDAFTGSLERDPGEDAGVYAIHQGTLALSSNYQLVYNSADLVINKAVLTVTAGSGTICLNEPPPTIPITYAGFKNGDNAASLPTRPTVPMPNYNAPGNYVLTPQGGVSPNYTFNYISGQLNVLPSPTGNIAQVPIGPGIVNTPGIPSGVQLTAPGGADYSYAWSTGESTKTITVKESGDYQVLVTHPSGCAVNFTVKVVKKTLVIPNIFSPNGDGIHDKWVIENLENFPGNVVQVYNRYGQLVFKMTNYTPWDGRVNGRDLPVGTYYYIIDPKNGEKPVTGYIDIIR